MTSSWPIQFSALLWKNFLLKGRQIIGLVVEILLTFLFFHLILTMRRNAQSPLFNASTFNPVSFKLPNSITVIQPEFQIVYVPSNSEVAKNITEWVKRDLKVNFTVRGFPSEKKFEDYVNSQNSPPVLVAIVFDHDFQNKDSLPLQVKYHLRFSNYTFDRNSLQRSTWSRQSASWDTAFLFPEVPTLGPRNPRRSDGGNPGYIRRGFLAVQHSVDKAIISYHSDNAGIILAGLNIFARRFPYPAYHHDNFMWVFIGLFPWIVVFVFSHNVLSIVGTIVSEKESRLKEYQLMIGLSNSMLWAAYFVTYFIMYGIIILLLYGVLFLKLAHERVLQYSDPSVVVLFLLCYVTSLIIFAFMISTFFTNASLAVAITGFFYFVSFFPQVIIVAQYAQMSFTQKITSCLIANIALAIWIDLLCKSEMKRIGVQWDNLFSPVIPGDTFTLGHVFIMLLVDACLYGLVTWYIEAVFPGEYGVPKRWYFFLQKSYWFGHPTSKINENIELSDFEESYYFEAEPVGLVAGIQIQHLRKEFKLPNNTTFVAVKDLTLNFYEDQITVLLGPNGAGKTTTLSILTGFYLPTSGKIYISGYDISKDMVHVRKSLGLCPQYDLLFPNMTVSEHLVFYCAIKGVPSKGRSEEMNKMLASFGLLQKRNELSKSLSGGMKRKLSIMIALIGGSKVVILDEPTTGMDPVSRRSTWDVLQQYKKGRTMLLTTHYMDEADTLGDRIAIMVKGTLQCCGSSIFLKKRYGVGYHLVIVKNPNCDVERISVLIFDYVPTAALENDVAAELSFLLPKEYTYRFEDMFAELEERQEELGIAAFGVSMTTLEEVFFAVSEKAEGKESLQNRYRNQNMNAPRNIRSTRRSTLRRSITSMKLNSGWNHFLQQCHAMILKRALYNWRNWKVLLLQLVGLLGAIYFQMSGVAFARQQEPALKMDLEQYGQTIVPYSVNFNNVFVQNFIKILEETLKAKKQKLKEVKGDLLEYLSKDQQCTYSCIVAYSVEVVGFRTTITFWFNNEAFHSPSLSLALLDDTIFKSLSGSSASITVSNKPQPRGTSNTPRDRRTSGIQIALNLFFGMSILVSGFCLLTVNERISKAKHIQFLSGVYVFIFWFSSLMWDFIILFLACCLLLVVFLLAELDLLIKNFRYLDTLFIFTIFAWSVIPFLYLTCFLFNSSTSAYMKLFVFNQCIGFFGVVMDFVLSNMQGVNTAIKSVILNTLLLVPFYNLGMSICKYYDFQEEKALCSSSANVPTTAPCEECDRNVYSMNDNTIGRYVIAMAATGFAYFLLILFLDTYAWRLKTFVFQYIFFGVYKKFNKETVSRELSGESEDEDIEEETYRVLSQPLKLLNATVVIRQLIKIYFKIPAVLAVRNISLAVQKKECFGLLGLNGAGKTTTFQILTAEDIATSGDVFVEGFSITKNNMKIRSKIGYCPQFDALLEYMTAREIMTMYARLWGVKESMIPTYVNNFLRLLELESHADKYIYTYSGGNKRRVSNAIAMMGKPAIIFLDEPSTGMDPVARRLLWNVVTQTRETGKAVIITSHSMEECDALCTRLAIMVQGKFVCLGSPQHLKNKFGNVYTVNIKFKPGTDEDTVNEFKSFIERVFPGSKLTQESQGFLNYYIPSKKNSWGKVFGVLEKAKEKFELEDYSISQITLEQVFLSFANLATTGRQNIEP
ncbi:phospholipid-transporting ATPase ABCA3-like [Ochotona curzoniae]|uniref:phospholipid-transporting ATPase ABCA3-like n=1 Tax=Ochotona curzoniae TaxID=130825 RepID=UPI001B350C63|nr:phospholipid-transporting ATPase ABCA3-like [Ochotona curzoniae]